MRGAVDDVRHFGLIVRPENPPQQSDIGDQVSIGLGWLRDVGRKILKSVVVLGNVIFPSVGAAHAAAIISSAAGRGLGQHPCRVALPQGGPPRRTVEGRDVRKRDLSIPDDRATIVPLLKKVIVLEVGQNRQHPTLAMHVRASATLLASVQVSNNCGPPMVKEAMQPAGKTCCSLRWFSSASAICLSLLMHADRRPDSRAALMAGSSRPIKMPMMAMTTNNSTSVNPGRRVMICCFFARLSCRSATGGPPRPAKGNPRFFRQRDSR